MKPDIETKSSRVVYQNRWMIVREDGVRRRDGSTGIYGVVEKEDYAVIAAIDGDVIHLVEQYRYPVSGRFWELPQGSWETNCEAELADVARGELREEVGIEADEIEEVGRLFQAYGYSNQSFGLYLARGPVSDTQLTLPTKA